MAAGAAAALRGTGSRASGLLAQVLRRLVRAVPTLAGVVVIDFFLLKLAPGDAADYIAAMSGVATSETMQATRERLGLDQGVVQQFLTYLWNLAHFNLGTSTLYSAPVAEMILARLPNTLLLIITTLIVSLILGTLLGVAMAALSNSILGRLISAAVVVVYSTPSFLKGLLVIILFSVVLGWLPSGGYTTIGVDLSGFALIADRAEHMALPVLTLSLFYIAIYARLVHSTMLDVQKQDYVRTAHAKGLTPAVVLFRHMLRNALLPLTTVAGIHVGMMLSGAVIVETVFAWPGLGGMAFDAVFARDYPLVLGILLLTCVMVIAANILVDIVHTIIDPTIRSR